MSGIGFPDFRRQVDYDTDPNISNVFPAVIASGTQYGPFQAANFAMIAGRVTATVVRTSAQFDFYTDAGLSVPVGTFLTHLDPAINIAVDLHVPVLARYFVLTVSSAGGAAFTHGHYLFGSNRPITQVFAPPFPAPLPYSGPAIGAGASNTFLPSCYASGHGHWLCETAAQPGLFELQAQTALALYSRIATVTVAAGSILNMAVVIPPTAFRVVVTNTGAGASNFATALTVSQDSN